VERALAARDRTGLIDLRIAALDALEQALHDRRPAKGGGLIHHSDAGPDTSPSGTPSA
jgi:hypothetical protein